MRVVNVTVQVKMPGLHFEDNLAAIKVVEISVTRSS